MLNSAEHEICPDSKSLTQLLITIANSFLVNIAESEDFSADRYENAFSFSYLLAEKFSCSVELSMKKSFITSGSGPR